jgi:exopolyphosphatase/guanosine-5'-triphosphate,3'-diphosphate pyrophosphatase
MQRISAIDVGSNAIRMAVGQVNSTQDRVDVIENIRIPVRLGQDVFTTGNLTASTMQAAMDAFRRFRKIADDYDVKKIRAVATSAMREAENGKILIRRLARQTGIQLEIISGEEEARLVQPCCAWRMPSK